MTCKAPLLPTMADNPIYPFLLHYGFILDNVTSVRNLSAQDGVNGIRFFRYTVYPNPTFVPFKDGIKYFHTSNDVLTIEVKTF